MTNISLIAGTLLILCFSLAEASTGKIAGAVRDAVSGDPLPGANVSLVGLAQGAVADEQGRFFILNVAPGVYALTATYIGYRPLTLEDVRVSADLTTTADLSLAPDDVQVEAMVVRAERPIIDKNATNAVRIVDGKDIEALPFRGVYNVLVQQAGVVEDQGRLHVRGSRSDEVGYYVEGANVRNVVTGFSAVNLIDEAIAEVQLQAGGFNAEYGGANSGIVLQELRTGGSEWKVNFLSETDQFTSKYKERLGTYSYGYSGQVLTLSGPVAGNRKIRTFLAGQRRVRDSRPVVWDGFLLTDLEDSGDRGGRIHWTDSDTPDAVETIELQPGNIAHTGREAIDFNGTLLFDFSPFQVRLTGLYSTDDIQLNPAPVRNLFNTNRLPESASSAGLFNVKATHLFDPTAFYEVNLSFYRQDRETFDPLFGDNFLLYNDSLAVARVDSSFTSYIDQGIGPREFDFNGFPFNRPGTSTSFANGVGGVNAFSREEDNYFGLGASLTKQTDVHQFKVGAEVQRWTSRRYFAVLSSIRAGISNTYPNLDAVYRRYYEEEIAADELLGQLLATAADAPQGEGDLEDFRRFMRSTSRGDFFGFDEFGRPRDGEGLEAPRHPVLASGDVQDKIEYADLIVNAGLRWDFFDADSWRFVDQAAPVRDEEGFTLVVRDDSLGTHTGVPNAAIMQKTRTFHEFSPRLGFSFLVSDRTVFHVQYGRFSQMPALRSMFRGGARLATELGGQNFIPFPTAFDIEPIRTTQYEIGFGHQFADFASFDLSGFYRDVKGQLQLQRQELSAAAVDAGAFNFLQNGDFATTKGLEFVLRLRRLRRLRGELSYTLSDARGTGSSVNSAVSGIENNSNLPTILSPLDFNQTHRGSAYIDYRFGENEGGRFLKRAGINVLFRFTSGHNYTLVTGSIGQRGPELGGILASDDPRSRQPLEAINSSTTPWTLSADLRLDKGFTLFGAEAQVYTYVQNLFDRRNVINVYGRTGDDQDDGFLSDPELSGQIVAANGGDQYRELYEAINLDHRQHYWFTEGGDIYSEPRQIRFGVRVGF